MLTNHYLLSGSDECHIVDSLCAAYLREVPSLARQFSRIFGKSSCNCDFDITDSDGDSLYDVDENIEELSDFDEELLEVMKSNIEKQAKKKADRVNLDEITPGPVGIDADFEDICKNREVRYEDKLGGDDLYFDSSDSDSDISYEEERDPVDDDEVVDSLPRTSSIKIYFDKTAKKICF
ncbi:hypothetical protein T459_08077 [Capsicum annuum]|uniref:Uncharacterized protein n=1 Tax=Capsicum annuum TaxID=4072 RepID=A0A2G2ZVI6_CAPAN|nr:hypothetical protein T459_08077 [Capsicum annuum]